MSCPSKAPWSFLARPLVGMLRYQAAARVLTTRALLFGGLAWALTNAGSLQAGALLREVWFDIPGTEVSLLTGDPRFPGQPSATNLVTDLFEAPVDAAENYGQRMHGY